MPALKRTTAPKRTTRITPAERRHAELVRLLEGTRSEMNTRFDEIDARLDRMEKLLQVISARTDANRIRINDLSPATP